jgi:transglutaminase-like putative cysteine protease
MRSPTTTSVTQSCASIERLAVNFEIVHTTDYNYGAPVSVSHHVARLSPRALPRQDCVQHELQIDPAPAAKATHVDYFGNTVTFFAMQGAHTRLTVRARSTVAVRAAARPNPSDTPSWDVAPDPSTLPLDAIEYLSDSTLPRSSGASADLAAYARPSFPPERPLIEAVVELTRRIHEDFTYDSRATTVATPLVDVFQSRRGVCQDFAHLEIACLRSLGLPARYVSGYLETVSPSDTPRLVGGGASHAWLAVYCPGAGWIDVDPTNNLLPSDTHVTLAWGREYGDVSPIRGVILGGGGHSLRVNVEVTRLETP